VQAVAGAPGIVTDVIDNSGTEANCSCMGNNNVITVMHSDSSISLYYHIRDGSSFVQPGDIVLQGQSLAYIGSAGCSSNPHLHFEVRTKDNYVIDPWVRPNPSADCNNRNNETWWQNQKPYWEPQVNRIMTHSNSPSLQGFNNNSDFCPGGESKNPKNNFAAGDQLTVGIAMHDYTSGTFMDYNIYYPNGSLFASGNHINSTISDFARWYLGFSHTLPGNAPSGTYKIAVNYFGSTAYHYFTVNCIANYAPAGTISDNRAYIASNSVVSDAVLTNTSNVKMQAAGYIQFNPGFTAASGATLKARIKGCDYCE
jgi:Peptidase family M23